VETLGTPGWPFPETPFAPVAVTEGGAPYEVSAQAEALGQVRNTYVVARTHDSLVIVDQHAAHEAVLTERILAGGKPVSLVVPVRLDLTSREAELLAAHLGLFTDLGLEVEPFGGNSFLARALPGALTEQDGSPKDVPSLFAELLEELAANRGLDPDALRERLAAKVACWTAVKAGDMLRPDQQQALLDDLLAVWSPSVCPHGRPALFTLTVEEMERRFLRR
jgi:DNA mismatch repair protein MutL